ncbi:MAG: hypothetical protein ACR2HR_11950 [Euzebya sp.]
MEPTASDNTTHPSSPHPGTAVGLAPGLRFKCKGCGNLTRFDVAVSERSERFWHASVSGEGVVEDTTLVEQIIESVTCRWCGSTDAIITEDAPARAQG